MMSLRLLSSLRNIPLYLKQSTLQTHTSVVLLNSKDSSSSSFSSDSSDSDSDKEDQRKKKVGGKAFSGSLKDVKGVDEALKTSDTNDRLNILLQKINEASQKMKPSVSTEEKEMNIEGLPSFVARQTKDAAFKSRKKTEKKTTTAQMNGPTPTKKVKKTQVDADAASSSNEKPLNVAIKPKSIRFNQVSQEEKLKQKPHEQQIKQAAKEVAETLGGDKHKTEMELLTKALNLKQDNQDAVSSTEEEEKPSDLRYLLAKMKVDSPSPDTQRNVTQSQRPKFREPSVAESLLYKKSITKPKRFAESPVEELKVAHPHMGILKKISQENKDDLQLPTWNAMEVREMRLSTLTVPQNVFQELIQWTDEGKIWHFPIDNEQGMEAEKDVHFSEHVFLERHLKGWCPKKGPIRHFMELVCVGLSKNPYLTVEEKVGHITWYKSYFEDKKELLHELGVLDTKATPVSTTDKKQVEA